MKKVVSNKNTNEIDVAELKIKVADFCEEFGADALPFIIGQIRGLMLDYAGHNSSTHFVCPLTFKILKISSGVKVITKDKSYRYHRSISWYYMSRKAFNIIKNKILTT